MVERFASLDAFESRPATSSQWTRHAVRFGYRDSVFKRDGRDRFVIASRDIPPAEALGSRACDYAELARRTRRDGAMPSRTRADVADAVIAIRRASCPIRR